MTGGQPEYRGALAASFLFKWFVAISLRLEAAAAAAGVPPPPPPMLSAAERSAAQSWVTAPKPSMKASLVTPVTPITPVPPVTLATLVTPVTNLTPVTPATLVTPATPIGTPAPPVTFITRATLVTRATPVTFQASQRYPVASYPGLEADASPGIALPADSMAAQAGGVRVVGESKPHAA